MSRALSACRVNLVGVLIVAAVHVSTTASTGAAQTVQRSVVDPVVQCSGCPPMVRISSSADPLVANMLVGQAEVTWREYLIAVDKAHCPVPRNPTNRPINVLSPELRDDYPMTSIKPQEVECYIGWLRTETQKPYRLPTEREWQAFAVIGLRPTLTFSELPAGSGYILRRARADVVDKDARDVVRWGAIAPTKRYQPSPAGLYDLFGNAEEATSDHEALARKGGGEPFSLVIVKGGDVMSPGNFHPIADRSRVAASSLSNSIGFRVVCKDC